MRSVLTYGGACGEYTVSRAGVERFIYQDTTYSAGECYSMTAQEIHSIHFSRGARVLFFEGPSKRNDSVILEPFVDGEIVETFEVKPWMFKRDADEGVKPC